MVPAVDWPEVPRHRLAPQEGRALEKIILNWPYKQIARELGIKPSTVKTYINRLKMEFGVQTKNELVWAALEANGWEEGRRTSQPVQVSISITRAGRFEFVRVDPSGGAQQGAPEGGSH